MEKEVTDLTVAKKFIKIHQSAQDRGLDFNLTLSEVRKLMKTKTCFYTGVRLVDDENSPVQRTFDRVDNDKGYVMGNVVACSKVFNSAKSNLTVTQIRQMVNGLKKKKLW